MFGFNRQILLFFQLTGIFAHIEIFFIVVIHDINKNYVKKISQCYVVIHSFF